MYTVHCTVGVANGCILASGEALSWQLHILGGLRKLAELAEGEYVFNVDSLSSF